MANATVTMPDGRTWTPLFVDELDQDKCIGCGRCFRVCGRDVLQLVGITEDGDTIQLELGDDEDEEYEKKVMTISHQENCVGCEACAKICPKKCYTHTAMTA
jgi:Nif-specific ferredoxin III